MDAYHAAVAFVEGRVEIDGDITAALTSWWRAHHVSRMERLLVRLGRWLRPEHLWQSRDRARENIEFHYDLPTEFYRAFLDSRLVYSCAYFDSPQQSLDDAQAAKLDLVCRKLDLQPQERLLDVGCGWGALVTWAPERYAARALGCTLSREQQRFACRVLGERGLRGQADVQLRDYRDVTGRFDKIASIGMVEHVGRHRLAAYFRTLADRLEDSGLLLNHGINRPAGICDDAATIFIRRHVFPGGELGRLEDTLDAAAGAGFEAIDVENLRPHYALTCRAWVARLGTNRDRCLQLVSPTTYRTWLLYLAGSAVGFENGTTDIYQVLFAKRSSHQRRRLRRNHMNV
jgi:cyclopropane-fatty-acyl-phospholipid synthase